MKQLEAGTILYVDFTGYRHYGLYIGDGQVIQNSAATGDIRQVSLMQFSSGEPIHVSRSIQPKDQRAAVEYAQQQIGRKYNLITENCEHFAREVSQMTKESVQVQRWFHRAVAGAMLAAGQPALQLAGLALLAATIYNALQEGPRQNDRDPTYKKQKNTWLRRPFKRGSFGLRL